MQTAYTYRPKYSSSPVVFSGFDYYPPDSYRDGMTMEERSYTAAVGGYRYGFNGMERDDDVKGEGNSLDFGARIYDSRLGRWLSVDPLWQMYPFVSCYNFSVNSPLMFKDVDGKKIYIYYETGEYDNNGKPIRKLWEYKPGIEIPENDYVKKVVQSIEMILNVDETQYKQTRKNPSPKGVVERFLKSNKKSVVITDLNMKSNDDAKFIPGDENVSMIKYNPNVGTIHMLRDAPGGKFRNYLTAPPAAGLNHEFSHAFRFAFWKRRFKKNDNAKNKDYLKNRGLAGQFPDGEEEAAVTFQDNAFLKFYGYGERVSYVGRNYTAVNPTSSTEKLSSDISEISAGQTIKLDTSKTENNWSNW